MPNLEKFIKSVLWFKKKPKKKTRQIIRIFSEPKRCFLDNVLVFNGFSGLDIGVKLYIISYQWNMHDKQNKSFFTHFYVCIFFSESIRQTMHISLTRKENHQGWAKLCLSLTCQLSQDPRGFNHPHISFQSTKMLDLQIKEDKCKQPLK